MDIAEVARRSGVTASTLRFYERKHVFTQIEWHMRVCSAEISAKTLPEGWILLDESYALPTAYRVCL